MTEETAAPTLTGKQARYLRGLGHKLQPVVMVGKQDVTDEVVGAVDEALEAHELIKIKLQEGCLSDRREVAAELAGRTGAAVAQVLGRTILLFRPSEQALLKLP